MCYHLYRNIGNITNYDDEKKVEHFTHLTIIRLDSEVKRRKQTTLSIENPTVKIVV